MKIKFRLNRGIQALIAGCVIFALIGFVENKSYDKVCNKVVIQIDNQFKNYFITDSDVLDLITLNGTSPLIGKPFSEINLKEIENAIGANPYVLNAEAYKAITGNLVIFINQQRPIARIIRDDGPDAYITRKGTVVPVSPYYTARVMILRGSYADDLIKNHLDNPENRKLLQLLQFIYQDEFWNSQIAEIEVDKQQHVTLYPQVTRQKIEFGPPEEIDSKFRKLEIFYQEILPHKGWNHYTSVNLKFRDQIICE